MSPDTDGDTTGNATALSIAGGIASATGVISSTADRDYFRFTTTGGNVSFTANVAAYGAMLDAKLELRDANDNLIAIANTASLSETLTANVAAGTYYVVVASAGNYGDIGQYTLTGTLPTGGPALTVSAGSGYTALEGGSTSLAATVLTGTASAFAWDLDGDGIYGETGAAAGRGNETGANVTFSAVGLDGPSTFTVGLRVTGTDGAIVNTTATIAITNVAPTLAAEAAPLGTINEGSALTVSFVAYDPGQDTITSWVINWGNGTTSTLAGTATSASKVYADNGIYTITLTATDEDGSYSTTRTVTVANVAPTLSLNVPGSVQEGSNATFTFSATDPGTDTVSGWVINWGDGTTSNYAGAISSATKKYADNGTHTVTLTATDEDGSYSITRSVTVLNVAPTLTLTELNSPVQNTTYGISFGATDPGTDTISQWVVAWGDGTTTTRTTTTTASKVYANSGIYTITLTATDEDGSYNITKTITVADVAPTLSLNLPATANEGSSVTATFSAGGSTADDVLSWQINWGDGQPVTTLDGSATSATHTYLDNGIYTVTLKATDVDSNHTITRTITVNNVAPTLSLTTPGTVAEGTSFPITFSKTDPGLDTVTAWAINWGDGSPVTTLAGSATGATKTYATRGTYTITLTATDEDGTYSTTRTVTASNVAPTLTLNRPTTVNEGSSFNVTFSAVLAGLEPITGWTINWGDGSPLTNLAAAATSATKTYADDGTYTITLTAADSAGTYPIARSIVVNNVAPTLSFAGPTEADEGSPASFSFSSVDPGADTIAGWTIEWGDGTTSSLAGNATGFVKTFADDGDYTIKLTATDEDGSYVTTRSIHVNNVAPILTVTGSADWVNEGAAFTLSIAGPTDGVAGWQIDWGDGNVETFDAALRSFDYTYAAAGEYAATLSALDSNGNASLVDGASVSVVAMPTATITPLPTLTEATGQLFVDVTYASARKFDVSAFKRADLSLGGFGSDVTVKMLSATSDDDGLTWQVRYTINRGTAWSFKDDGTYSVGLKGKAVFDRDGRALSATPIAFDMRARPLDEAGNDLENARQLGNFDAGRVRNVTDFIGPWDKSDLYRFKITQAGITKIRLNELKDNADIKVFDGHGTEIAMSRRSGVAVESLELELPKGFVYIRVYDTKGSGTPYALRVEQAAKPAPVPVAKPEPGDKLTDPIQLGTFNKGKVKKLGDAIGGGDDSDYFRFKLASRGRFEATLSGLSAAADLELLDGNGRVVTASRQNGTTNESLSATLNSGWYYIRVLPGTSRTTTPGTNYSLRLAA